MKPSAPRWKTLSCPDLRFSRYVPDRPPAAINGFSAGRNTAPPFIPECGLRSGLLLLHEISCFPGLYILQHVFSPFLLPGIFLLSIHAAGAERPNIVLINADNLGWAEVGCYVQKKIKTLNLDKLASESQRWVYFYSSAPVCSPSRNVLLTGKHTDNCDVQDLKRVDARENWRDLKGDWPIRTKTYTLPEALKKAGYTTAVFGKWGIGDFGTTSAPDKHGVDRFYGYTDQKSCHTYYPPYLRNDGKKKIPNPSLPLSPSSTAPSRRGKC